MKRKKGKKHLFSFFLFEQVTAKGSPDVALSWVFDLQLGMARLFGQLCSAALDNRKGKQGCEVFSSARQ